MLTGESLTLNMGEVNFCQERELVKEQTKKLQIITEFKNQRKRN